MPSIPHRPPPLHWLTVLRYPAALGVLLCHSLSTYNQLVDPTPIPDSLIKTIMERGYMGVSFFFILSGFILAYNYPVIVSKSDYLCARAARILPVYYLSLVFSLPWLIKQIVASGLYLGLIPRAFMVLTLTQAWLPKLSGFWNYPAWTLSCEAFFYVSLVFFLAPLTQWLSNSRTRLVLILTGCFLAGLVAPFIFVSPDGDALQRFLDRFDLGGTLQFIARFPAIRILEFIAGAALCVGTRAHLARLSRFSIPLLLAGFAEVFSSYFLPAAFSTGTYCLPGFALVILGAAALPFPNLKTSPAWVRVPASLGVLLGNASYAVYLFHASVLRYFCYLDRNVLHFFRVEGETYIWHLFFLGMVITTTLSIAIYYFYEEPARRWAHVWLQDRWDRRFGAKVDEARPQTSTKLGLDTNSGG